MPIKYMTPDPSEFTFTPTGPEIIHIHIDGVDYQVVGLDIRNIDGDQIEVSEAVRARILRGIKHAVRVQHDRDAIDEHLRAYSQRELMDIQGFGDGKHPTDVAWESPPCTHHSKAKGPAKP